MTLALALAGVWNRRGRSGNVELSRTDRSARLSPRFWLGETLLEATRLSTPCRHIEEIAGKAIFKPLINRSGLNCKILRGGTVRLGDPVRPVR